MPIAVVIFNKRVDRVPQGTKQIGQHFHSVLVSPRRSNIDFHLLISSGIPSLMLWLLGIGLILYATGFNTSTLLYLRPHSIQQ